MGESKYTHVGEGSLKGEVQCMEATSESQTINSYWYTPLPLKEYATSRVTVYYYSDSRWVPIKYCSLGKAISLYQQAKLVGKEILLFPTDLDPNNF